MMCTCSVNESLKLKHASSIYKFASAVNLQLVDAQMAHALQQFKFVAKTTTSSDNIQGS